MKLFVILVTGLFLTAVVALGALGWRRGGRPAAAPIAGETAGTVEAPRRISRAELGAHGSPADCWIAVDGEVYDVTRYIDEHPAPKSTIADTCGSDATVAFATKNQGRPHSAAARALLKTMKVGDYVP